jgi:HK97 family phage portal protein
MYGTMEGLLLARRGIGSGSTGGQAVSKTTVATIPAVHRAWSFAANAVAMLTMGVWKGDGVIPTRVTGSQAARLFTGVPNPRQDWYRFWYTVAKSLEARNSGYVWKTKNAAGQVIALTALHPDQVFPFLYQVTNSELQYPVMFSPYYPTPPGVDTYGVVTVDRETIWHIRGDGGIGEQVPMTPIQTFATSLGIALAKQDYEANLYENGVMGGLAVTFPDNKTREQARDWMAMFDADQAGTGNSGKTKVIGGGATMTQIGMTPKDAQFIESGIASMQDVANITGVPKWVLNIDDKAEKGQSPEQDEARWFHHGLKPRLARICSSLSAEPDIFGPGATAWPMFDTADSIHPDSLTAAEISLGKVQSGQWTPDEARAKDGLPPHANGVGQIPQQTPVGGAPNPAAASE